MAQILSYPIPARPPNRHDQEIYSNLEHVLRWDVADDLAHDQSLFAQHSAKNFCGYVFAVVEDGTVTWYEQVWIHYALESSVLSKDLQKLIIGVTDVYGYA